jgi:outer membrane protein OmpA-like peptidoglycan-associated protein
MRTAYLFITLLIPVIIVNPVFSQRSFDDITTVAEFKQYAQVMAPNENAFVAVQRIAKEYIDSKDWQRAALVFASYSRLFPNVRERFTIIDSILKAPSQNLILINLKAINTKDDEYFPVITIDENRIYFTGSGRKDNIGGEDIFYSNRINGEWTKAKILPYPFSTYENDAVNSVSADGNILVVFGTYKGAIGQGDNFYSERTASGWSDIKPFPVPVNSKYWDCDGFLSADGKAFLFVSDRPGGVGEFNRSGYPFHGGIEGNTEIYVSMKTDSGWSAPINLGDKINTPYAERSPFLHPDGKTLYFSSDGYYGLGELDVYKSVRLSDTSWTEWSKPINLGKDINTSGMDIAYKISTKGDLAYFSSNSAVGKGGYDLYSITLPPEARPQRNVVAVKGKVTDEDNTPLDADINWADISANANVGSLKSDPVTGDYMIVLPVGKTYSYFADKQGYYSVSNEVDLFQKTEYSEMNVDIKLISIKSLQETAIKLNNIYFDFDKYNLKPESYSELERVNRFLADNPGIRVEISAHTDAVGNEEYNLSLSQKRAQSVVDYLISRGINSDRLIAKGYGKSQPVASNDTEEGRALNRRVEMKIIK